MEFENHRPLYDWYIKTLGIFHSRQMEFARLNLTYTMMSKRRLLELVKQGIVKGWDDPRMPTICGFRRRGYTPEAIRNFCARIGVAKVDSVIDVALLEHCLREDLNKRAARVMAVLRPLKVVITNYPEGQSEELEAVNNPEDAAMGTRKVPFCARLWIEQDDFREDPPKGYYRLSPGKEVRLRWGYLITCTECRQGPDDGRGRRTALHLRPGHPRRQRPRRPQGERHDPLGFGRACRAGRGAALRKPLHRARSQRRAGRRGLQGEPESQVAGGPAAAVASNRVSPRRRPAIASSSSGLGYFAVDPRYAARQAGVQPHRIAAGYLGEDRESGEVNGPTTSPCCAPNAIVQ